MRICGTKIILPIVLLIACSCSSDHEEPVKVSSSSFLQDNTQTQQEVAAHKKLSGPRIRVINIGPSKDSSSLDGASGEYGGSSRQDTTVPKEFSVDATLTGRLHDKLKEAYASRGGSPPEIEIYTGSQSLDQFARHYEDLGYKILRTSVPAGQVIGPLLNERPELASRISLANYSGVNINQVIVEGANISAADKYIDPVTYEVVYKTFVTVTKVR